MAAELDKNLGRTKGATEELFGIRMWRRTPEGLTLRSATVSKSNGIITFGLRGYLKSEFVSISITPCRLKHIKLSSNRA